MCVDAAEVLEKERRLRLETSMKMRAMYQEKQKRWQQFREAEKQRRVIKARVKEMNRLNSIIEKSRARREYSNSKFQQTLNVRSYHQAALVIQRTFRRMKKDKEARTRMLWEEAALVRRERWRAALVIQRSWRLYRQRKLFKAMHFRSIMAGPVIAVGRRQPSPPGAHSYERGISITGKLIETELVLQEQVLWDHTVHSFQFSIVLVGSEASLSDVFSN